MAYLKLFLFSVASLSFMFIFPSHSSFDYDNAKNLSPVKNNDKVTLSLYYETLCPYCSSFITNNLVKVFQNDLDTIVNLRLIPWGNARIVGNKIQCQHGENECYLNTIHSCAIHLWPDVKKHFKFIQCSEERTASGQIKTKEELWEPCSEKLIMSEHKIKKCYNSGYGDQLELQYANETASLRPPHEYVPWVTVNNQPLLDDFQNFVKYVCEAYKGHHVPKACKAESSGASVRSTNNKAKEIHPACYANKFRNM